MKCFHITDHSQETVTMKLVKQNMLINRSDQLTTTSHSFDCCNMKSKSVIVPAVLLNLSPFFSTTEFIFYNNVMYKQCSTFLDTWK